MINWNIALYESIWEHFNNANKIRNSATVSRNYVDKILTKSFRQIQFLMCECIAFLFNKILSQALITGFA